MTCRHQRGDPACTAGNSPEAIRASALRDLQQFGGLPSRATIMPDRQTEARLAAVSGEVVKLRAKVTSLEQELKDVEIAGTEYEVMQSAQIGEHLVLKVKYPSCSRCSFEGEKVIVFLRTTLLDAVRWKKIDPHFREQTGSTSHSEAPPPAARFPATDEGWADAINYVRAK